MTGDRDALDQSGGTPPIRLDRVRPTLPVAALLFSLAAVFGFMSGNLNQTSFADVMPALVGTVAFALLVWSVTVALRRRADASTAVIACAWVVASLFYLSLFGRLNAWLNGDYSMVATLPVALVALLLITAAVNRVPAVSAPLHSVLGAIALVMTATPLWQAASFEWRNGAARAVYDADAAAASLVVSASSDGAGDANAAPRPDIYHIVFDRYGSAETLARHYGVEPLIGEFLEAQGFYVARDSHSSYLQTGLSLASTFYMDYLDGLSGDPRLAADNWHPIFAMLDDHRVGRFLRAKGYRFVQFGSWWVGSHASAIADENHPHGFGEFDMLLLRRTILRPLFHALPDTPLTMRLDWDNAQCQRVARQVEQIKSIGVRDEPVYVFAHILVPHGPYVFAPDGRCLTQAEAAERGEVQGYIDQIAYADRIIEDLVGALQAPDRRSPVIIIQADEGPFPERDQRVPWQDASAEELRIKTGILNAFYFPDGGHGQLRPTISPVNTYPALFNTYFGTTFPQHPDRIVATPNGSTLFEFHDVTDRVRNSESAAPTH